MKSTKLQAPNSRETPNLKFPIGTWSLELFWNLVLGDWSFFRRSPPLTPRQKARSGESAFTLIEVLLALSVSAIVLAAIGGVFYSAVRLRERTTAMLDEAAPLYQALAFLRRDLLGAVPPSGMIAGDFKTGTVDSGMAQGPGLQFCTSTGVVKDGEPWGDVQEVSYELRNPVERTSGTGKDLVRSVTRNLLATTGPEPEDQWLMGNVETLEFSCYDGTDWQPSWDTSLGNTNLPSAVRVRILLAADNNATPRSREPLEMIVPLVTQARAGQPTSAGGGQ